MNRLTTDRRAAVIRSLCEGNSVRATCRLTGTAKGTVLRLLAEIGEACRDYHNRTVRNIKAKRVQCDEIWSFCYAKEKNVPERMIGAAGDLWTWVGLDADSKLAIAWRVGDRGLDTALPFVKDVASRLANRVQLTTDGHHVYLLAIREAFGWEGVDYSMLVKRYTAERMGGARYSPPTCIGATRTPLMGKPDWSAISTSHVERQNLTVRMQMRRFTRLTNAFSKKAENHVHAVALHFVYYNFCRVHQTLTKKAKGIHRTPAMAAGLTDRVWTVSEIVALLDSPSLESAAS